MSDFVLKGCPACRSMILNGKEKYSCKADFTQCQGNGKCKLKNRVYDVLDYLDKSDDIEQIKEAIKEVTRYLREKR